MAREIWRAALSGDLARAEARIADASAFGESHGAAHAPDLALIQRGLLEWQRGDSAAGVAPARAAHDSFKATFPGATLLLARLLVDDPSSRDEAASLLEPFCVEHFANLPDGPFWASGLVLAAETAHCLGHRDASETIRDLLLPYIDQVAFSGMWVTAPVAYGVGVAAAGCGDDRAHDYFEQAGAVADQLRASVLADRVYRARTHLV